MNKHTFFEKLYDLSVKPAFRMMISVISGGAVFQIVNSILSIFSNLLSAGLYLQEYNSILSLLDSMQLMISCAVPLYYLIAFSLYYAEKNEEKPLPVCLSALFMYLMLSTSSAGESLSFSYSSLVTLSFPFTLLCAFISCRLYAVIHRRLSLPAGWSELLSFGAVIILSAATSVLSEIMFHLTLPDVISRIITVPIMSISHINGGMIIYLVAGSLLYMTGIHGPILLSSLLLPLFTTAFEANEAALLSGSALPYPDYYLLNYILIGGTGATLALNLLLCSPLCKNKQHRKLGYFSLITSVFNINEPLMFGLPVIMNPVYLIPVLICPILNLIVSRFLMNIGFLVPSISNYGFFIPAGIYGSMIFEGTHGILAQIFLLIIDILIYYPFFRIYESKTEKNSL